MKIFTAILIGSFCLVTTALAVEIPDVANDRIDLGDGVFGITHTENFEYVCTMKEDDTTIKTYLDVDFSGPQKYRFAAGFVGGGSVMGMVAAEANVVASAKGRCANFCVNLTIESEDKAQNNLLFQTNAITGVVTMTSTEEGKTSVSTCEKNEVE